MATNDMVEWLTKGYGLEPWAAHLLIGYQGRYDVVTVAGSVALRPFSRAGPIPRSRCRPSGRRGGRLDPPRSDRLR